MISSFGHVSHGCCCLSHMAAAHLSGCRFLLLPHSSLSRLICSTAESLQRYLLQSIIAQHLQAAPGTRGHLLCFCALGSLFCCCSDQDSDYDPHLLLVLRMTLNEPQSMVASKRCPVFLLPLLPFNSELPLKDWKQAQFMAFYLVMSGKVERHSY